MNKPIIFWECGPDLEQRWALAVCEEQQRAFELEEDLAIDLELNPYEQIHEDDIEYVPLNVALSWRD